MTVLNNGIIYAANTTSVDTTTGLPQNTTVVRLAWIPQNSSFIAGTPSSNTTWNYGNLGIGDVAIGYDATFTGNGSVSLGYNVAAVGNSRLDGTVAIGSNASATGQGSIALGRNVTSYSSTGAENYSAVAIGENSNAGTGSSVAIGVSSSTGLDAGIAIGYEDYAGGWISGGYYGPVAMGWQSSAEGQGAASIGAYNYVYGFGCRGNRK